ncbi:unnamed protein product [Blepharisma stoltei]|uniref:Uncharacterized protein n=1 Tax=Blepharisma stoltei TaxID=1481888 RepID=A0AAU9K9U9_9CILI|nr:unnamed protein product [Blepharisma stoltei]
MDIDIIPIAIEALQEVQSLKTQIEFYRVEIEEKNSYIKQLEEQIAKPRVPQDIIDNMKNQEIIINSLQQKIEELEQLKKEDNNYISNALQNSEDLIHSNKKSKVANKGLKVIFDLDIWLSTMKFLNAQDILSVLFISPEFAQKLCCSLDIWKFLTDDIKKQIDFATPIITDQLPPPPITQEEHQELSRLFEKYVIQQYPIGKTLEPRLINAAKTLLGLQKSIEIATSAQAPQEKFNSIAELIVSKFQVDRVIDLLHRTTAWFSANPSKTADWTTFIQNTFAGLLYDGAMIMIDSQELNRLKDFLVEKVKKAKEKLNSHDQEKLAIETQLLKEREIKEYLIMRVHDLDMNNSYRVSELAKMSNQLTLISKEKEIIEAKLNEEVENYQKNRKILAQEINNLRKKFEIAQTQKSELLGAFEEFNKVFNTLGLIK